MVNIRQDMLTAAGVALDFACRSRGACCFNRHYYSEGVV